MPGLGVSDATLKLNIIPKNEYSLTESMENHQRTAKPSDIRELEVLRVPLPQDTGGEKCPSLKSTVIASGFICSADLTEDLGNEYLRVWQQKHKTALRATHVIIEHLRQEHCRLGYVKLMNPPHRVAVSIRFRF